MVWGISIWVAVILLMAGLEIYVNRRNKAKAKAKNRDDMFNSACHEPVTVTRGDQKFVLMHSDHYLDEEQKKKDLQSSLVTTLEMIDVSSFKPRYMSKTQLKRSNVKFAESLIVQRAYLVNKIKTLEAKIERMELDAELERIMDKNPRIVTHEYTVTDEQAKELLEFLKKAKEAQKDLLKNTFPDTSVDLSSLEPKPLLCPMHGKPGCACG